MTKASVTLRAPAKLNLTLEVLARRSDGWHGIRSVMVPVDLFDEIEANHADGFSFNCDEPRLQNDNLAVRAMRALDLSDVPLRIALRKRIPTGAGMGGGSSDAAAMLLAAQRGVFGRLPRHDYVNIARSLGSDVPFFLVETAALVEGTGERVTALGRVPSWHAVAIKPPVDVSTAWAYRQLDANQRPTRARATSASLQCAQALQAAQFDRVQELLQNDFHDVVVGQVPEIAQAARMLAQAGAPRVLLTGSGACVFALAQTASERARLADRVRLSEGYSLYALSFWNGQAWR